MQTQAICHPDAACVHPDCSATSMLIYQVQSGRLDASQLHRQREQLLAVAAAFQACCTEAVACLESNAPMASSLRALERLHGAFIALGEAAGGAPAELWAQPGSLAFSAMGQPHVCGRLPGELLATWELACRLLKSCCKGLPAGAGGEWRCVL